MISIIFQTRLLVDIFCGGSGAPTIWISMGPKQNLMGPPLKYITNSPILWGPLGPQAEFHKGPIGFSRALGPCFRTPRALPNLSVSQNHVITDDQDFDCFLRAGFVALVCILLYNNVSRKELLSLIRFKGASRFQTTFQSLFKQMEFVTPY